MARRGLVFSLVVYKRRSELHPSRERTRNDIMAEFDLAIRGGTIVTASDTYRADVGIRGGRIMAISNSIEGAARTIDASGLLVMPGGIDSHVHLSQPAFGGPKMADDFLTGDGYTSFKVFMTYDELVLNDRQLLEVFECARSCGALVMVHAEGYDAIKFLTERLERSGQTAPYYHAVSRPQSVEREATHRAISHAELLDVAIMIVHVSSRDAMEQIRWAQQRGLKIHAETCPQYIALTADDLKGLNMDESGGKYVCSPPPRDHASWEAIWEGIQQGVFATFSSDHCPFYYEGPQGKRNAKARTSFRWVPNGIPGVETRLQILWSKGVAEGRITPNQFVALTSTNHAKMYGMYPKKGSIGVGFDADIVLWDANRKETIRQELMHHAPDYTPYEGLAVTGWPMMTILRGKVVAEEGKILGEPGDGMFLRRELSPYAKAA
jgi:dihydropyrimidinase